MSERLPDNLLIIGVDGYGAPICTDMTNGEIIFWDTEGDLSNCIGDDFYDYLQKEVTDYLEWEMKRNGQKTSD